MAQDPATAIHIPPSGRTLTTAGGAHNQSSARRLAWANATTIGGLGHITGARRRDIFFDTARGLILFDTAALATYAASAAYLTGASAAYPTGASATDPITPAAPALDLLQ